MSSAPGSAVSVFKLILEENGQLQELEFEEERITIGRTADNAVKISDALSSRHHCQIARTAEGYRAEDLKSRNGTKLNGEPLTEATLLQPGDRIEVGDSIVHFGERLDKPRPKKPRGTTKRLDASGAPLRGDGSGTIKKQSARAEAPPAAPIQVSEAVALRLSNGADAGKSVKLAPLPFVIGRKKGAGLQLQDDDVSNEHCMVVADAGVLHLVDLGSTNGTFVDGERLRGRAALLRGTTIRLGPTLSIEVVVAGGAPASAPPSAGPSDRASGSAANAAESAKRKARSGEGKTGRQQKSPSSARAEKPPPEPKQEAAVDEVADLDALGGDESEPEAPPRKGSVKSAPPKAAAAGNLGSAMEAEAVGADLGSRLEAAATGESAKGGVAIGAVVVAASVLFALGAGWLAVDSLLKRPEKDPSPEENLLANWSFEDSPAGAAAVPGWELAADPNQAKRLSGSQVRYGQHALALQVDPSSRPELRSAKVRVTAEQLWRVNGSVALDGQSGAALLVEWSSDTDPTYLRQSVVTALPLAAEARDWRAVTGTVISPRGATDARVVAVAVGAGNVRLDRISFAKEKAAEGAELESPLLSLAGPARVELLVDPRGLVAFERGGLEVLRELGLALDPRDLLAGQAAILIDQPLASQADGSLLALGRLPYPPPQVKSDLAFTVRATSEGVRLRWSLGSAVGPLWLTFRIPHLPDLSPLALDGNPFPKTVAAEGQAWEQVSELSLWKGGEQVSLRLTSPARLEARPVGTGLLVALHVPPTVLPTGEVAVGIDLGASSLSARSDQQRLLREAEAARRAGELGTAIAALETLRERYPQEKELVALAQRDLTELRGRAERLAKVVEAARDQGREAPVAAIVNAARSALADLERVFPRSRELEAARARMGELEAASREAERRELSARASELNQRALRHREAGRTRLARRIWTQVIERFPADLKEVVEAKGRLEAMPEGER